MNPRIKKLRQHLTQKKLDAVLISSLPNIVYLTGFTHFFPEEREAFLLITRKNNYILTDKRYTHAVQTHVTDFILLEIFYGHGLADWIKTVASDEKIQTLGIEENNVTYAEYKKIVPYAKAIKDFDLEPLRIIKSAEEIAQMQKACSITDAAFAHILNFLKKGVTEKEVAEELELFIKRQCAEIGFTTIVAFEENAAYVHHQTSNRALQQGDAVLMDFGAKYGNYCADMSRTVFLGKATPEKKKAHQTVKRAQELANDFMIDTLAQNKKLRGKDVDSVARKYIIDNGYETFPHGLGHGIGLQVHEAPYLRPPSQSVLTSGMMFTNEPGIYLPHKFGIRIEDDFAIVDNKLIQLTNATRDIIEI